MNTTATPGHQMAGFEWAQLLALSVSWGGSYFLVEVTPAALAGLAVLSTAVAYIIYFRILASAGATNLLRVTFLIPATAILLGVLVLGETLLPRHVLGMLLIGFGLARIDGRPWRRLGRWGSPSSTPVGALADGN